ncbi:hypothetical protein PybrP1_008172 [[Pythium] brassicae (nom. inval.)]|nr:hypothetical protein PybrP1_008172 [[Pythium] brassicae (nom. inval.)]
MYAVLCKLRTGISHGCDMKCTQPHVAHTNTLCTSLPYVRLGATSTREVMGEEDSKIGVHRAPEGQHHQASLAAVCQQSLGGDRDKKTWFFLSVDRIIYFLPSSTGIDGGAIFYRDLIKRVFRNDTHSCIAVVHDDEIGEVNPVGGFEETATRNFVLRVPHREQFEAVVQIVSAVPSFRAIKKVFRKLIGITCDGAASMVGIHRGFATRVRAMYNEQGGSGVVVNWRGSHQLNLAVGALLDVLDELVAFLSVLGLEISFTRKFETVFRKIVSCPTCATTRWDSIADTCAFLAVHHDTVARLQDEKQHARPSAQWWLCLFAVAELGADIKSTFEKLQYQRVTMMQQYEAFEFLVSSWKVKYINHTYLRVKTLKLLSTTGYHSPVLFADLDSEQQDQIVSNFAAALSAFVVTVASIQLEARGEPDRLVLETPFDVVSCDDSIFHDIVRLHDRRL